MAKKRTYYQRYVREGRWRTIYCCKQFSNVYWGEARKLVRDYSEKSGMRRKGRLRRGECPSEYRQCR